jgi:hypothetical protein
MWELLLEVKLVLVKDKELDQQLEHCLVEMNDLVHL